MLDDSKDISFLCCRWPGSSGKGESAQGSGWDVWDTQAGLTNTQGKQQRQGSAFTPAPISMSPSPTPGQVTSLLWPMALIALIMSLGFDF